MLYEDDFNERGTPAVDGPSYAKRLRTGWRALAVGAVLGGALGGLLAFMSTPEYQTNTRFFISTSANDNASAAYEGDLFSQQRVTSYAELITDQKLVSAVIHDLSLPMTTAQLTQEISASVVPNTVILDVTVTDTSPTRAVAIARSVQREFTDLVTNLETPDGSTTSTVTVHVIADPQTPTGPTSPTPTRDILLGIGLGLLFTAAGVVVRARLDTRIRDGKVAARAVDAPAIGVLLQDQEVHRQKVLDADSASPVVETLRQIAINLDFLDVDHPPQVLTVTSAVAGEGKTTLATNLAVQLAGEGKRVILVEADLRRPRTARFLGVTEGAGLTHVLNGSATLDDVLQDVGTTGHLRLLAAGPSVPNPGALLGSDRMAELIASLRQLADMVLIDAAPLLPVADTSRLVPLTDGAVLCVRWGTTRGQELSQAGRTLGLVGARTLGVVMTFLPRSAAAGVGYGSVYGEREQGSRARDAPRFRRQGVRGGAAPSTTGARGPLDLAPADGMT